MSARARWDDLFDRPGDLRPVALTRALIGPVVVLHLAPVVAEWRDGVIYRDRFHVPFWDWLPHPPRPLYVGLLVAGLLAGVAMTVGWHSRLATAAAFAVVAYNLVLDGTGFHHNRAFLLLVLGGLALLPTGRSLSLDAVRARRHGRPPPGPATLWPLWLLRALVASVYLASGTSKLLNPSWRDGTVLWDRVVRYRSELEGLPFESILVDVLTARTVHAWFAPTAIAVELFIGLGLWFGSTRYWALWVAILFHLSIEVGASVEVFSVAALAALTLWVTPTRRDRVLETPTGSVLDRVVGALDWFARFERCDRRGTRLVDRDGTVRVGRDAVLTALMLTPALFFAAAPAVALSRARGRARRRSAPGRRDPAAAASPSAP